MSVVEVTCVLLYLFREVREPEVQILPGTVHSAFWGECLYSNAANLE